MIETVKIGEKEIPVEELPGPKKRLPKPTLDLVRGGALPEEELINHEEDA